MATIRLVFVLAAATLLLLSPGEAGAAESVTLPKPRLGSGVPLMQALKSRHSSRSFSARELPKQVLSELLWAAYGVNRPDSGRRTAPSAHDRREVDLYVAMKDGLYRYDADNHALILVAKKDLRAATGRQKFPGRAPLNIVYVADLAKMPGVPRSAALEAAAISTGAIVQNVYLYAASEGLAAVVRGWIDKKALAKAMGLRVEQYVFVAQTVGYPGE
jgi:SagB-type dehydrogenase family enzyme